MNIAVTPRAEPPRRPVAVKRAREDQEFLPAALEILDTPASPVRMAFIIFISTLAVSALLWTWFGKFDIVATAQGKVQPAGRVKVIQSAVMGKTVSAPIANGTRVKAGDVLVQLDDVEISAEKTSLSAALAAWKAEAFRRRSALETVRTWPLDGILAKVPQLDKRSLAFPSEIPEPIRQREQLIYEADLVQLISGLKGLSAQRIQHLAQIEGLNRAIAVRRGLVATLSERVDMRSALVESSAGSRASVIDAIEVRQKEEADLAELEGQLLEAKAAASVAETEAAKLIDTFTADYLQKQSEAARQIDELSQNLVKAESRQDLMNIKSPIDGTVQASALTTVGQVVQAGNELMRLVPDDAILEVEAYLPNRDIGFVAAGQLAVVKVEAFPFTRYGTVEGKIKRVAVDAVPEPDAQQLEQTAAKELQTIVPVGNVQRVQNLVFPITVELLSRELNIDGKFIPLSPGMTVTVEVKTGQRRILEYLLSPITEVTSEAMNER